ncbi:MAG TPA: heavy metal-binding domain-containing protein [Solirubrobacteraceae bacterium]
MSTDDSDPQTREPLVEDEQEQEQSLKRVEAGGIPLAAERRLREIGEHGGAFTSDLSVGDFALCHQLGLKPVSQVMGSSIYQVGYQATPWPSGMGGGFMFEMEALSEAWNEVRDLALGRLAQEATHVGADAVVGVDLRTGEHDWAENAIEYVVIGTAIRHDRTAQTQGGPRADRPADGNMSTQPRGDSPVLTELSVADYAKLMSAGVEPLGVVAWSSVFFVGASYSTQMMSGVGGMGFTQNQELREFTQGVYSARETVVARLTEQAARLDASGVIGVRIAHSIRRMTVGAGTYSRGGLMVTFHAIGTAIREDRATIPYAPETIVDLTT